MSDLNIYIRARATGKSTTIMRSWFDQTKAGNLDVILLVRNHDEKKRIIHHFCREYYFVGEENLEQYRALLERNVIPIKALLHDNHSLKGRHPERFLIDDYLFFSVKEMFAVYETYCMYNGRWTIYTTANRIYKSREIEFVKQAIVLGRICGKICIDFSMIKGFIDEKDFWELKHNLICQPEANIDCRFEEMRTVMPLENFRSEILGEFRE